MNCSEIIWVITGHGPFAQYLARMKVIKENKCNCDNATEQSAVHLLLYCPKMGGNNYVQTVRRQIHISPGNILKKESRNLMQACIYICNKNRAWLA